MKFKAFGGAILLASTLTLAACGSNEPAAETAPEGVPGMSVQNARMVLNAVEGQPAAVYFDLNYDGDRGLTIRRADVTEAESATIHDYGEYDRKMQMMEALPIGIKKGDKISFEPGAKHVMAFNLDPSVQAGGKAEITLTVSGGDKFSFPADVRAAGEER